MSVSRLQVPFWAEFASDYGMLFSTGPLRNKPQRVATGILRVLLLSCALTSILAAQEKPDSPAPAATKQSSSATANQGTTPSQSTDPNISKLDKEAKDEVPKRIFWIIPNFMTTNDQPENEGPLTTKEKYTIAWHQFADVSAHFGNLVQASISQAANGEPHYGQGWGAFGERFAAQEGDQFTGSFLIYGVLPQLLHQDPRYFRKGRGSAWSRVGYAASRVVIARNDDGKEVFNAAQIFGQLGQAGISLSYYPQQDRSVTGLFVGWAINQGYNIGWNQLKEFTPDLGAFLKRRSDRRRKMKQVHDSRSAIYSPVNDPSELRGK